MLVKSCNNFRGLWRKGDVGNDGKNVSEVNSDGKLNLAFVKVRLLLERLRGVMGITEDRSNLFLYILEPSFESFLEEFSLSKEYDWSSDASTRIVDEGDSLLLTFMCDMAICFLNSCSKSFASIALLTSIDVGGLNSSKREPPSNWTGLSFETNACVTQIRLSFGSITSLFSYDASLLIGKTQPEFVNSDVLLPLSS